MSPLWLSDGGGTQCRATTLGLTLATVILSGGPSGAVGYKISSFISNTEIGNALSVYYSKLLPSCGIRFMKVSEYGPFPADVNAVTA